MALAFTIQRRRVVGDRVHVEASVAFDDNYPDNGEAFTAADFGLIHLDRVNIDSQDAGPTPAPFLVSVDNANSKFVVSDQALLEEAAATDTSAITDLRVTAIGW